MELNPNKSTCYLSSCCCSLLFDERPGLGGGVVVVVGDEAEWQGDGGVLVAEIDDARERGRACRRRLGCWVFGCGVVMVLAFVGSV